MTHQLTRGAIADIIEGGTPEKPVLQILSMKSIPFGSQAEHHRLVVSDGQWTSNMAILSSQLNGKVASGEISQNCIIQMNNYVCNSVQVNKKVLIILDLTVIHSGADVSQQIGNPQPFDINKVNEAHTPHPPEPSFWQPESDGTPEHNPVDQLNSSNVATPPVHNHIQRIYPIECLTPYMNKWTILARVTNKSDVLTWSNPQSEGKLFCVELFDESGEIRCKGFNQELDKFYELLKVNKVYYVSGARVILAKRQYSDIDNDYEIILDKMTKITLCDEDDAVPTIFGVSSIFKTFAEAQLENLGAREEPDYYNVNASAVLLTRWNCPYTACPSDGCNKKVIDLHNGLFRCQKCECEYNSFKWRLMLTGILADASGVIGFICFQHHAEILLGKTAQELGILWETDTDEFQKVFTDASYKEYTIKLKVKMDTSCGEPRRKTMIVALEPLNPAIYNRRLKPEIRQMAGLA